MIEKFYKKTLTLIRLLKNEKIEAVRTSHKTRKD